jgi:ribonucleoside-diphosphate reductase beta chain
MSTTVAFRSAHSRGLPFDSPPMRLWQKAKKLGIWNPQDIDLTQDARDWQTLSADEQDLILRLTAVFWTGEEAVTVDLLPFIQLVADEGRLEEEIYLTSFLWEEAKHVEMFARFFHDVAPDAGDLTHYHNPAYRTFFYEELPASLRQLRTDQSVEAQARASATYHLFTEGVLAETGYHAYYKTLRARGVMPGMQQAIDHLKRDESRHLAYGLFFLSRLVAEHGDRAWNAIEERMNELIPLAMASIQQSLEPYALIPFGLRTEDFLEYALTQFQHRIDRLQKARGQTLDDVYRIPDFELPTT